MSNPTLSRHTLNRVHRDGTTTWTYANLPNGRRSETETGPGGVTRIITYHRDGQIYSITGSGVIPEYYEYTVNHPGTPANTLTTTVRQGSANSSRWRRTVTDGHGRTLREDSPLPGERVLSRTHHYDSQGRLVRVQRSGGLADERTAYNSDGRVYRRGLDIDGNGSLQPGSNDRIVESDSYYEYDNGWWQVQVTRTWLQSNSDTPTEVSRHRSRLGLGADSLTETTRADGSTVTTASSVNRSTGTVTTTVTSSQSSLAAVSVSRYGRLLSQSSHTVAEPVLYSHDALGRMISVTDPRSGQATTVSYNEAGQQTSVTRPGGLTTSYHYYPANHANAGQLHWSEDPLGKRTYQAYNSRGQLTHQWGSGTYPLRHVYDDYGTMVALDTWRGGESHVWNGTSQPGAFGTQASDRTEWVYEEASGLLLQKKDASEEGPVYTWLDSGLPGSRTWARGVVTTYSYNNAGDQIGVSYSDDTPNVARTYRRDGSVASVTDAAGTTTHAYNGMVSTGASTVGGLLDGLTLSHPVSNGQKQSFTASLGSTTVSTMAYGYDNHGRLASVSESGLNFSASFTYVDDSDLPHTTISQSGTTTVLTGSRSYDNAGRLTSIAHTRPDTSVVTSHSYTLDVNDRRTKAEREDGTAWHYGYNDRGEVTSATKHLPDQTPLAGWQQAFAYDNLGNRLWAEEGGNTAGTNRRRTEYTSNELNQYAQIVNPGGFHVLGMAPSQVNVTVNDTPVTRQGSFWHHEFSGLPNSNNAVWQAVQVEAVDPGAGPGGSDLEAWRFGHRYVPRQVEVPSYDADGNLLTDGRWVYVWDGENRLIEVRTASVALAAGAPYQRHRHRYDSQWRRIQTTLESWDAVNQSWSVQSSERYLHDEWNVVAVVDDNGDLLRRYAWGNDISGSAQGAGGVGGLLAAWDADGGRAWCYAYDGNGNVSAVVDLADGSKVGRYDYDAFGRTIAQWGDEELSEANRYRFSTKPLDGTGLYYYGYRWLETDTGRWLSVDPIGEEGGWNLYGFAGNRSANGIDVLGLKEPDLIYRLTRRYHDEHGTYGALDMIVNNPYIRACCGEPRTYLTMELPPGAKKAKYDKGVFTGGHYSGLFKFSSGDLNLRTHTGAGNLTSVSLRVMGAVDQHRPSNVTKEEWDNDLIKQGLFINTSDGIAIHRGETPNVSGGCILPGTRYVPRTMELPDEYDFPMLPPKSMHDPRRFDVMGFDGEDSLKAQVYLTYYVWCARKKAGGKLKLQFLREGPDPTPLRAKPVAPPAGTPPPPPGGGEGGRRPGGLFGDFFRNIGNPSPR